MAILDSTIVKGDLTVVGTGYATSWVATSDQKLKKDLKPFFSEHSILDLPIYYFNYIDEKMPQNQIGCLAQDLEKLFPELVTKDKEKDILFINESKLIYPLLAEVKRQKEEIELLKKEIELLKK